MSSTQKLMAAFALLILGAVLIGTIATITLEKTTLIGVTDNLDISAARDGMAVNGSTFYATDILSQRASEGWRNDADGCSISTINMFNQTGDVLVSATDYTWTKDGDGLIGTLTLSNTFDLNTSALNTTTISYSYCDDDYLAAKWQRSVINLVGGFMALAMLAIAVGLFYSVMKEEGLLNI